MLMVMLFCPFTYSKVIHVDDDGQADFDNIQAGIGAAEYGDTVSVAPGTYYENITLKNGIDLSGTGAGVTIIDAQGYGDVVDARADNVTISGFTLRNSGEFDLGHMNCGVYSDGSYAPIVRDNVIVNNIVGIGIWYGANLDVRNNIIKNNSNGLYIYGSEESPSNPVIINNTIVNNETDGITLRVMVSPIIVNNIIAGHITGINHNYVTGSPTLSYNNLWHNDVNYMRDNRVDDTLAGPGSISVDPYFAELGYWADVNDPNIVVVEPNDQTAVWIDGDYHLKSRAGRYNPNTQTWVVDDVTSPCIDAGDPNSPVASEPDPNGGIINMGVYGGTAEASKSDYSWWFSTTQGPILAEGLGVLLPHEHIFTDLRGPTTPGYGQADPADVVRIMKPLLVNARQKGVGVLFECSSIGVGRNVFIVAQVAQESDLPVVVPTGVYGRGNFAPAEHRNMTEDELTALFINEIREGIEDTGIKAGFIKIGTDNGPLTALQEKILRAAGRAAHETGAAIASHTTTGSNATRQADILESMSPNIRFIWVNAQKESNRNLHRQLAARGIFIEFDSLGRNLGQEPALIAAIKELIAAGYGDRILLSHDAGWYRPGQPNGGTQKPYTYLVDSFIQKLRNGGVDEAVIQMITETNPIRAFGFKSNE
jgi:phosphotriesterase-related protein